MTATAPASASSRSGTRERFVRANGEKLTLSATQLAFALLALIVAPLARAHDIYTSLAEAKLLPDKLEITLTLSRSAAQNFLPNTRTLPPITPETFPELAPVLRASAPGLFQLHAGGKPLELSAPATVKISGDSDAVFVLTYPRPKASPVRFFARYVGFLVDGHIGTLVFTDATGAADYGWSPVSIDMPTFEAPLPGTTAPKKK